MRSFHNGNPCVWRPDIAAGPQGFPFDLPSMPPATSIWAARILCKVILDTWRFILGYIAKYPWILFRGGFCFVFSWFHWISKRQCVSWQRQTKDTSTPKGAGVSTGAVQFQGKWQQVQYDFYNTVNWLSLWRGKVCQWNQEKTTDRGKFPYKGI